MMDIKDKVRILPKKPGVYLFKNDDGKVIYVGKAKNLRHRVRSYFSFPSPSKQTTTGMTVGSPIPTSPSFAGRGKSANDGIKVISKISPSLRPDPSKQEMVKKIADLDTIACDTEIEALVLEANLIKKHQPPYNVLLRDDKFYLFIKITTNEEAPRVFTVRRIKKDKARYFGPYSSAAPVRETLRLLRRIFPHLAEHESPREQVFPHPLFSHQTFNANKGGKGRFNNLAKTRGTNPSLPPLIGGKIGTQNNKLYYNQNVQNIIRFLQGKRRAVIDTLAAGMKKAADEKNYEAAAVWRDQLRAIERLEGYQKVYLPRREAFDVISIVRQQNQSAANVFSVREGKLLNKNTFLLKHRGAAAPPDILRQFILQYFQVAQDVPPVIFVPHGLTDEAEIARWINQNNPPKFAQPQRGKKRQLMLMGELNAQQLLNQETAFLTTKGTAKKAMQELLRILYVEANDKTLQRTEIYDISNIQGKMAVGSMATFINGQPEKSSYKKFKIQAGETPNDVAMLHEVLTRRFSSRHSDWPKPDLILIDGGRGQLNVAQRMLKENNLTISLAALAKREEELFISNRTEPIKLPYDSPALFLIQRMRDEAHRFGLAYHRLLRSKQTRRSILDDIPGLGPKSKKKLLNHFGSVQSIRQASTIELAKIIGRVKTDLLKNWL